MESLIRGARHGSKGPFFAFLFPAAEFSFSHLLALNPLSVLLHKEVVHVQYSE